MLPSHNVRKLNNYALNDFILIHTQSQNRKKAEKSVDINGGGTLIFSTKFSKLEFNTHRCIECPITSKKICKVAKEEIEFLKTV